MPDVRRYQPVRQWRGCLRPAGATLLAGFISAAQAQTNPLFSETFDTTNTPAGANAPGWSGGGGLSNVVVTYVNGAGVSGSRALVLQADFTQAGSGYVAYQYANQSVTLNPSTNLADYVLAFDIKVNNPGLSALQCVLQSWGNVGYGGTLTATPTGSIPLGGYTPGAFKHLAVNLSDASVWPGANGFNPGGGTWQIQLQVNGWDGAAVHTGEAVTIDNLAITMAFSTSAQGTLDWNDVHQRIDGFGASSAWMAPSLSDSQADMFFSTNNGIGLSLLRNRIAPGGTTTELVTMQKAQARGARVWSTPWSPATTFKDSGTVNGGNFVSSAANYQGYANQLAGYTASMKTNGVSLYAISAQNEPDFNTTNYESCIWTSQQMHDFIPYLAAALTNQGVAATKILMPEDAHWQFDLATNTLNDTNTAAVTGILAAHNYGSSAAAVNHYGKPLWETEIATFDDYDGSMTNALYWAGQIHTFLTLAEVNAWHFWWLLPFGADNEGLTDLSGNPAKRMYALGNYSRFVRPNYYRLGAANNNPVVLLSAYRDPVSGQFAIVAVNTGSAAVTQVFNFTGFTAAAVTPWVTSATLSLSNQPSVSVSGSSFTNTLPAMSVVTFAGQAILPPPPLLAVQARNGNVVLSWPTNAAGYTLESSTNLAWTIWNPVLPLPTVGGDQNMVTNAITNGPRFYRLKRTW